MSGVGGRIGGGLLCGLLLAESFSAVGSDWSPREGKELIGTPAPEWRGIRWIQGGPLTLADLRGHVVLLRFWLTDCPYCRRTAPALCQLYERYRGRGLVVVALHHPKSEEARDETRVARATRDLGFTFPVGMDDDWATLRAYGVGTRFQRFTSVSFLIDTSGIIRFVHDGGEYHEGGGPEHRDCNEAYEALEARLKMLLPSSSPGGRE